MIDLGEDLAHVTLVKVFDPATGYDPNTTPPDGTRWVGFEGTIVVDGSRAGEDATSFDVIGSDGQTYGTNTAYFLSAFDGCTDTDGNDIKSGQTETFCSAVGLPPGVTVAKVGYSTEGVSGSAPAVLFWTVIELRRGGSGNRDADSDISAPTDTPTPDDGTPTDTPSDTPSPSPSPGTLVTALVERWAGTASRASRSLAHISSVAWDAARGRRGRGSGVRGDGTSRGVIGGLDRSERGDVAGLIDGDHLNPGEAVVVTR